MLYFLVFIGKKLNNERDERETLEPPTLNPSLLNFSCGDKEFSICGKSFRNVPAWVREFQREDAAAALSYLHLAEDQRLYRERQICWKKKKVGN